MIRLRTTPNGKLRIDGNTIRGVAVMTTGEAAGHGWHVDRVLLQQTFEAIRRAGRVKSHFTHPESEGLPLTIGWVENPTIDGQTLRADLHLLKRGEHTGFIIELANELPDQFGMSATFDATFELSGDRRVARLSRLYSVDCVGEPAANTAGLLSAKVRLKMSDEMKELLTAFLGLNADATDEEILGALKAKVGGGDAEPADETGDGEALSRAGVEAERNRAKQIRGLAKSLHLSDEWAQTKIDAGWSMESCKLAAVKEVQRMSSENNVRGASIQFGHDLNGSTLEAGITDALAMKFGARLKDAHPRATQLRNRRVADLARMYLHAAHIPGVDTMSDATVLQRAINDRVRVQLSQSTSDFSGLLEDSAQKTLRAAYVERTPTWQAWAKRGTLRDYRPGKRPILSTVPNPVQRFEGGTIEYKVVGESTQTVQLAEYTAGLKLTRHALLADDLGAFDGLFDRLAAAAVRTEDNVVYSLLTSNPTMEEDNTTLFHDDHANQVTTGGSGPSVLTIGVLAAKLRSQKVGDAHLNLGPKVLLVPPSFEVAAMQAVGEIDPDKNSATRNPWSGLTVVIESRLADANPATGWYLIADSAMIDTAEVLFLESEPTPVLKSETDFATDDVRMAVRHSVGAKIIDWRGFTYNDGNA